VKLAPLVLLAACGGSTPAPAPPPTTSNTAPSSAAVDSDRDIDVSLVAPPNETPRETAVRQAREAGILGDGSGAPRSKDAIREVVRASIHLIQACYERELLSRPSLAGTTTVAFTIETDGTVSAATGSGFDTNVDTCTADVVKGLVFQPAPNSTQVNYPFTFRPAPDTDGDGT
jgi:outer membrane biosynthesis protein TonB